MAKNKVESLLHDSTIVEVVMRKEMTIGSYLKLKASDKSKGWRIQAYQLGVYSPGIREEVK